MGQDRRAGEFKTLNLDQLTKTEHEKLYTKNVSPYDWTKSMSHLYVMVGPHALSLQSWNDNPFCVDFVCTFFMCLALLLYLKV